jgi:hypothetical protein
MSTTSDADERRQQLVRLIQQHAAAGECWERAEHVVRASELRERLAELGVDPSPEVAASLMATALLLAGASEEFGGDYRDALGDVAALGLELLDG